ncbi:hypothetical protein BD779DRAFT_1470654 [Infundibulicybe gibba]|nr:hypothetical protein BD779DRAFT_1470654 [Infundibulicybe gibba]
MTKRYDEPTRNPKNQNLKSHQSAKDKQPQQEVASDVQNIKPVGAEPDKLELDPEIAQDIAATTRASETSSRLYDPPRWALRARKTGTLLNLDAPLSAKRLRAAMREYRIPEQMVFATVEDVAAALGEVKSEGGADTAVPDKRPWERSNSPSSSSGRLQACKKHRALASSSVIAFSMSAGVLNADACGVITTNIWALDEITFFIFSRPYLGFPDTDG